MLTDLGHGDRQMTIKMGYNTTTGVRKMKCGGGGVQRIEKATYREKCKGQEHQYMTTQPQPFIRCHTKHKTLYFKITLYHQINISQIFGITQKHNQLLLGSGICKNKTQHSKLPSQTHTYDIWVKVETSVLKQPRVVAGVHLLSQGSFVRTAQAETTVGKAVSL